MCSAGWSELTFVYFVCFLITVQSNACHFSLANLSIKLTFMFIFKFVYFPITTQSNACHIPLPDKCLSIFYLQNNSSILCLVIDHRRSANEISVTYVQTAV